MCNCGNKRKYPGGIQAALPVNAGAMGQQRPPVSFKYVGNSALTVTGSVTGKRYRYTTNGEVLPVDHRDSSSMQKVPVLRRQSW